MRKKKVFYISIVGILLLIGVSYAVWQLNFSQTNSNLISSACFDISYTDQDNINLQNAYPMLDSEGRVLTPYQFTITNHCNEYASYQVNLEVLNTTDLNNQFVKVMFHNGEPKLLTTYTQVTKTLSNATSAYKMTTGFLNPNQSITYSLRLWLDENVTMEDNVSNKSFASKITITSVYKATAPTLQEECEAQFGEGSINCSIIGQADPDNSKCLHTDENGVITDYNTTMSDSDTPIVCEMEDDYGTSYYLRGLHTDNNVKFANSCWKIIRTTGSGGIKLIYNGDLDGNGTCTTTSGTHPGITMQSISLYGNKLYGTSYSKEGDTYTLNDTSTLNFENNSDAVIGKYTCGNTSNSCSTLHLVTGKSSSTYGYVLTMNQSTNYAQIGTAVISNRYWMPAYAGYMFDDFYFSDTSVNSHKTLSNDSNSYYYGSSFTYNENNPRPYTLTDTIQFSDITDNNNLTSLNTHHYTCFYTSDNTCDELYFIFYSSDGDRMDYLKLEGDDTIEDLIDKSLRNNNINVKNSEVKRIIDWWYELNILNTEYEKYIEDSIYCNNRSIRQYGGWSETGVLNTYFLFDSDYNLKCPNKNDAFTVDDTTNGNGALDYPIGMITSTESILVGNSTARNTGEMYWTMSPRGFNISGQILWRIISSSGGTMNRALNLSSGVRPSISLKPGTKFVSGGDGTASNPYVVDMS